MGAERGILQFRAYSRGVLVALSPGTQALAVAAKRSTKRITQAQRAAFHEAGHAVAAYSVRLPFAGVSIVPNPQSGQVGHVPFVLPDEPLRPGPDGYGERRAEKRLEHRIVVLVAGIAAEGVLTGRRSWRGEELEAAKRLALTHCSSGEEVDAYLKWLLVRTENELRKVAWRRMADALAAALEEHGELSYAQARWIMEATIGR